MENLQALTGYDYLVLALLALFIGRGIWVGFIRQITGIVALCVAYFVASHYNDKIYPLLKGFSDNPKFIFLASCVVLFIATYIVVMLLGKGLARVMDITIAKWFDKLLGAVFGALLAFFVIILLHLVIGSMIPAESRMLKECATCPVLNPAADIARSCITDKQAREALMQRTQAISAEDVMKFLERRKAEQEQGENRQAPEEAQVEGQTGQVPALQAVE